MTGVATTGVGRRLGFVSAVMAGCESTGLAEAGLDYRE